MHRQSACFAPPQHNWYPPTAKPIQQWLAGLAFPDRLGFWQKIVHKLALRFTNWYCFVCLAMRHTYSVHHGEGFLKGQCQRDFSPLFFFSLGFKPIWTPFSFDVIVFSKMFSTSRRILHEQNYPRCRWNCVADTAEHCSMMTLTLHCRAS